MKAIDRTANTKSVIDPASETIARYRPRAPATSVSRTLDVFMVSLSSSVPYAADASGAPTVSLVTDAQVIGPRTRPGVLPAPPPGLALCFTDRGARRLGRSGAHF
ncbi:hypothetical protein GCM10012286_32720 [Streptomyces lasiicapitis]|uniref:Uncharacterized protein n=1 Tax=Streptomyces lasiicapitis TaxID=1923961 RepID=A0ABQ2LYR5_9ACTN|nr:hypothetical protein GCM10012286_32720 [Streptomyces lasiicapitis]